MFAVVRIKGTADLSREIRDTLKMLRLDAVNNCVLIPETPDYKGMVKKVSDFVAYGIIDFDTFSDMLKKRGRLITDEKLTEENIKETGFNSIEDLAKSIFEEKIKIKDVPKLKSTFRLTPPSKGHKSVKDHYPKGSLGYWKDEISELLKRMI